LACPNSNIRSPLSGYNAIKQSLGVLSCLVSVGAPKIGGRSSDRELCSTGEGLRFAWLSPDVTACFAFLPEHCCRLLWLSVHPGRPVRLPYRWSLLEWRPFGSGHS